MGGLDGPKGAQQVSTVPEEDKFEGQLVPQVWKGRDSESNFFLRNLSQFIWTLLYLGPCAAYRLDMQYSPAPVTMA